MKERDCENCVHHTEDGCSSWDCEFERAMTREEAMQELQNCKGLIQQDGQDYLDERDIPLLDMAIEALSADAVDGEWIDMEIHCNPYPPIFCVECSRCGYRVGRETFLENTFNFCPSCGARMKGGAE